MGEQLDEYIREWLVLGPFFPDDMEIDFLAHAGGEANVDPREGDSITTEDERVIKWKRHKSKVAVTCMVDVIGEHKGATAYAFCTLQSETACDVLIRLGADESIAAWINGDRLSVEWRRFPPNEGIFEASLKAGANRLLVKVSQVFHGWHFGVRVTMLMPDRAVLSGIVSDEAGQPVPGASVRLEQDGKGITGTHTYVSGSYRINVYPVSGSYDLSATKDRRGDRLQDIQLHESERRIANLILRPAVSITGTLLMLDRETPHAAVPVQAIMIHDGRPMEHPAAATLSNDKGEYRFVNLKPGLYRIRCQVQGGYVYYVKGKAGRRDGDILRVESGETLNDIDFHFAEFKKGTWRNYDTLDGLAFNVVSGIDRNVDGAMWFSTQGNGISRYDGREFFSLGAKDGLWCAFIASISCDSDGTVWAGTWGATGGVYRYDGKLVTNLTPEDGLAHGNVRALYCDPDGLVWFGTDRGVSRYDGKRFVSFTTKDGLAHNIVESIYRDPTGIMWFGTRGGVSRYDGKDFTNFTTKDGLAHNWVNAICSDSDGVMWFGTGDVMWFVGEQYGGEMHGGVSRYDGREFVNFTTRDGLVHNWVKAIYCDDDGVLWFGTHGGGVSRYDGKTFVNFTTADGLGNNVVNAIYGEPGGVVWFGTGWRDSYQRGGISRYDGKGFVNFTARDGMAGSNIWSIYAEPDGAMWLGTWGQGVSRYDGREFVNFSKEDGLLGNIICDITCDIDGMMWFAVLDSGVSRYDGKDFINFTRNDGLLQNKALSIYADPDGVIWVGSDLGISRYDGNSFTTLTVEDGLPGDCIWGICRDSDGAMWFTTLENGVSRYDGEKFVNLNVEQGLTFHEVFAVHRDADGMIWFGTEGGGVSRYDGKEFVNFTSKDGLANDNVLAIHSDPDGRLWFGTDGGGVSCFDGTAWTSLDTRDGLLGKSVVAIYQDPEGFLWFGTDGGLTRYWRDTIPPNAHIVSVTTDQTYRDFVPAFTPGTRVTIEYNSIDLKTVPEKRQYRCCVYEASRNVKNEETKGRRHVPYPEFSLSPLLPLSPSPPYLPPTKGTTFDWIPQEPGTYIFQVQAIDRDLNYSEPAMLELTVEQDPVLTSMQAELNHLRRDAGMKYHFENIIGRSTAIRQVRALMERAIDSGLTALIIGETGTGKELVAKAIHYNSQRKDYPLLDLNCGAVPKDLVASTLFGHRKGAFTGANEDKVGLFEAASGGTVLLDEISEMPRDAQIHLLRVLEERKVQRLGEHTSRDVDVRIIAMTNRDLGEEVKSERFREDLYYRLSEFPIHIPPLRERLEDVPLLADHFLQEIDKEIDSFAPEVFEMLQSYSWPGNVRELRNVVRRAAALAEEEIQTYHFPSQITRGESLIQEVLSDQVNYNESVARFRRRFVEEILRECEGNRSEAARRLGMDRSNLRNLMKRLGIE